MYQVIKVVISKGEGAKIIELRSKLDIGTIFVIPEIQSSHGSISNYYYKDLVKMG